MADIGLKRTLATLQDQATHQLNGDDRSVSQLIQYQVLTMQTLALVLAVFLGDNLSEGIQAISTIEQGISTSLKYVEHRVSSGRFKVLS